MDKIIVSKEFFNIKDTLECGQVFRFRKAGEGYFVNSKDKVCYAYEEGKNTIIETEDGDYFHYYFDLDTDYEAINQRCQKSEFEIVRLSSLIGKGIRILRQDPQEMIFSFLTSQNNMIPRIKSTLEKLSAALGKEIMFKDETFKSFPSAEDISKMDEPFFTSVGYGYRAPYMKSVSKSIAEGTMIIDDLKSLSTDDLKKTLLSLKGIGPKVADCVSLFGFHRTDSFPVDTWIEKIYHEDFHGELSNRNKITEYFLDLFKEDSGFVQQYLFHYKRNIQDKKK